MTYVSMIVFILFFGVVFWADMEKHGPLVQKLSVVVVVLVAVLIQVVAPGFWHS